MHFLAQPTGHLTLQMDSLGHLDGARLNAEHVVGMGRIAAAAAVATLE